MNHRSGAGILENLARKLGERNRVPSEQMQDVEQARFLIERIGAGRSVGEIIYSAYRALARLFPHQGEPKKQWTERRLRAWWNGETDVVRYWQMLELYEAAKVASDEDERIKRAREEHAEFIEKTAVIAAMVEQKQADFDRS